MVTRRQHYVWRHYLSQWKDSNGLVWCLRGETLFQTNPINVMVERDFYRLTFLTKKDIFLLRALLLAKANSSSLRELHESLIHRFTVVAQLNERIHTNAEASAEDENSVRRAVIEAEEWLQSGAENDFIPVFERVLARDDKILDADETALSLIYFLCMQYFRTKNMRERIIEALDGDIFRESAKRISPLLCHCAAVNVGQSLYLDRQTLEIILVEGPAGGEFITGDQPVVNILAKGDGTPPEEIAFFYPLCPHLALILAPKAMKFGNRCFACDHEMQQSLNDLIAANARESIVASGKSTLMTCQSRIVSDTLSAFAY